LSRGSRTVARGVGRHWCHPAGHCGAERYQAMTDTIPLQFRKALVPLLAAIPGMGSCELGRTYPVGENEIKPVCILTHDVSRNEAVDTSHTIIRHSTQLRIKLYFDIVPTGPSLDEQADPFRQAIHAVMNGPARNLPGVQGIYYQEEQPEPEGDAGALHLVYTVLQRTSLTDLTQPL
jgi:hypothetical protein